MDIQTSFKRLWRASIVVALLAGLAALAGGCDDDKTTPISFDLGVVSDKGAAPGTIVEVASQNPDFSTLVAALGRAGLVETLKGPGPFTVFAPNNQAFVASGITDIKAVPVDDLKTILLYHVVTAKLMAADVKAGPVTSAADLTFFVTTAGGVKLNGGNTVKGGANVIATDVMASNGVIHVIDRVLLPPDIPACATYGGLTGLTAAIGAAAEISPGTSLLEALQGPGPFTVFAPTNEAFKAITAPSDPAVLRDVLLYHAVGLKLPSSTIPAKAGALLKNAWAHNLTLLISTTGGVKVNGSTVLIPDIKCTNGLVHVIDAVLLPPSVVDMVGIAGFTELGKAVAAAAPLPDGTSVADALKTLKPLTVFAPTNAAFQAITVPTDPVVVRDVLLLHVVKADAPVTSDKLPTSPVDSLLSGKQLTFTATPPTVSSAGTSAAAIGPADIHVTNGVIHVISKVLLP